MRSGTHQEGDLPVRILCLGALNGAKRDAGFGVVIPPE
jgi:hypothetical protein